MDRLHAPNTEEGAAMLQAELAPVFAELFGADVTVTPGPTSDPRAPVVLDLAIPAMKAEAVLA